LRQRGNACNASPEFRASISSYTSLDAQRASRAPDLYTSVSQRLQHTSRASELHTSMCPTRPYARSTPVVHFRNSVPLRVLHVPTPAARLHHISGTPYLYASYTYTRSAPPELQSSIPLCVLHSPTPAARLQRISRTPYVYASYTSLHPQHASRSLASTLLHHTSRALELHTSTPPRRWARSIPPELHAFTPPRLHTCSACPDLHTSRPLHLHVPSRPRACSMPHELHISIP